MSSQLLLIRLVPPEDIGCVEVFSFSPDEDGTGTLDSLVSGTLAVEVRLCPYHSNRDVIHRLHRVYLTLV